jgi:hypothetical protein
MSTVPHSSRSPYARPFQGDPALLLLGLFGIGSIAFVVIALASAGAILPMIALSAVCLGALVVVRPEVGIVAIVLCASLVKLEIGTGTGSAIVTSLLAACVLVVGWAAHRMLHKKKLNLLPRWLTVSIVSLTGFTFLSWIWGHLTLDPRIIYPENFYRVQMAQAALIVISASLLFVGGDLFRSRSLRNVLAGFLIVIGMVDLLIRAVVPESASSLLSGTTINTFGLFGVWFVALCWANAVLNVRLSVPVRLLLAAFAFGWLAQAILVDGDWVSGWLPPAIAMIVISFIAGPRVAVPFVLGLFVLISTSFSYVYYLLVTSQIAEGSIGGNFGRIELWKRNIELSMDWLLLGSGPAGYVLYYVTFIPNEAMSTHSNYIDLLSQIGVGGVLSFVLLLVGLLVLGFRTWPHLNNPTDRAICAAVLGGVPAVMAGLWLGDWLIPFVYNQTIAGFNHSVYSWLMLAILSGLIVQHLPQERVDG